MEEEYDSSREVRYVRELNCQQNLLHNADGSARFSQGDTSVLAAVYGPAPVKARAEKAKATVEVIFKDKSGVQSCEGRKMEELITSCCKQIIFLDLYPRSAILITVQIENDDGSLLSCVMNASIMALMNAAVPLKKLIGAVTCAQDEDDQSTVLDPTAYQEKASKTVYTIVFDYDFGIIALLSVQLCPMKHVGIAVNAARTVVPRIFDFYRNSIQKNLEKLGNLQ